MADPDADALPENLDSAHQQLQTLLQALADQGARVQQLERENEQLLHQTKQSNNSTAWLLDWALQENRRGLFDDLWYPDTGFGPVFSISGRRGTVLTPLARAHLSAEVTKRCCFKFLDLPAELRNRVYDLSANAAFSVPSMLVYRSSDGGRFHFTEQEILKACGQHSTRRFWSKAERNRLAMLRVSCQINKEARQIYYMKMSLDLRFMYHPQCLPSLLELLGSPFKTKLQFVRHIEVEADVAHCLLFGRFGYHDKQDIQHCWRQNISTSGLSIHSMNQIALLLFNLEAITVCVGPHHYPAAHDQSIGFEIVTNMVGLNDTARNFLERCYPRLTDIIAEGGFGAERFRKTAPKQWELYYSRERLPASLRSDFDEWDDDNWENSVQVCDVGTGLMHSRTLSNIAGL